ncbi:CoA pyrophosphatase [Flavobacterium sp. CYK-55]|uniref:NUDIX hydrolase n=1 Tax=Flavobacterium sp. CYK-55 TaxID=2835529 RepID=UPI001BCDE59D|nr:CoA pyrophosphatase [Flavobacterium sp. CYK-55]MBS7786932.1 CoA pyrophosphatase [Flavobacterium sp. CYK-55]
MNFQTFLHHIDSIKKAELLAEAAHELMMPPERRGLMQNIDFAELKPKQAAVMMLLYPKNQITHLVLIERNSYPGVHSAQIAFPGGKIDSTDVDFASAALRETFEEVGVEATHIQLIRAFSEVYIPPSNFMVYPFLGVSKTELTFKPDPVEVTGIIEVPLAELLDDTRVVLQNMDTSYSKSIDVPSIELQGHFVWGATAMMLSELKETLRNIL